MYDYINLNPLWRYGAAAINITSVSASGHDIVNGVRTDL